jgi:hypothetical protein
VAIRIFPLSKRLRDSIGRLTASLQQCVYKYLYIDEETCISMVCR